MTRRSNKVSLNLEGQQAIHKVGSFEEALHLFLRDGKMRNLSEYTIRYYKNELTNFRKILEKQKVTTDPAAISKEIIKENVIYYMMENGRKEATINAALRAIRALFNFLEKESYILTNPTADVSLDKRKQSSRRLLRTNYGYYYGKRT